MYPVPGNANATLTAHPGASRFVAAPNTANIPGSAGATGSYLTVPLLHPRGGDGRYPGIVRLFRAPLTREKELRLAAAWKKQYPEQAARIAASCAPVSAPHLRSRTSPVPAPRSQEMTPGASAALSADAPGFATATTSWGAHVATSAIQLFEQMVQWGSARCAALDHSLGQLLQPLPGAHAARTSPTPVAAGSSAASPPTPSPNTIASACPADGCDISALLGRTAYGVLKKAEGLGFELLPYRPTARAPVDPRRPPFQIPAGETLLILGEVHENPIIARAIQALFASLRSDDVPIRMLVEGTPEETASLWAQMRNSHTYLRLEVIGIDPRSAAVQDAMARLMRAAVRFSATFHKVAPDHVRAELAGQGYSHKTGIALENAWKTFIEEDAFSDLDAADQVVLARDRMEYIDALTKANELASSRERDDALVANIRRQRSRDGITVVILGARHLAACQALTMDQEAYLLVHQNAKAAIGMAS